MDRTSLFQALKKFTSAKKVRGKGPLCVVLVVTRKAIKEGLPLNPKSMLTDGGGQVSALGKAAVQSILNDHGIERILAEEGGRTSRGSIANMRNYVEFVNNLHKRGVKDFQAVEDWWIGRVKEYFAAKPFVLRMDSSKSLRAIVRNLIEQAQGRQDENPGTQFAGAVLQHLVGAKLEIVLNTELEHRGSSVADESSGKKADFLIGDVAIHVTTTPSEALIRKCGRNLDSGLRPMIVTTSRGVLLADGLASQAGFAERIDVFEAEQFIAGNLYELGQFKKIGRQQTAKELVEKYNWIISKCETDPSLLITTGE